MSEGKSKMIDDSTSKTREALRLLADAIIWESGAEAITIPIDDDRCLVFGWNDSVATEAARYARLFGNKPS